MCIDCKSQNKCSCFTHTKYPCIKRTKCLYITHSYGYDRTNLFHGYFINIIFIYKYIIFYKIGKIYYFTLSLF